MLKYYLSLIKAKPVNVAIMYTLVNLYIKFNKLLCLLSIFQLKLYF